MVYVAPTVNAGAVPVVLEPVQPNVTAVEVNVPAPPVAVNAVSPVLCHVTAPAVDAITPNNDVNATPRTTQRAILLMMYS
jgi:hypothetical protein